MDDIFTTKELKFINLFFNEGVDNDDKKINIDNFLSKKITGNYEFKYFYQDSSFFNENNKKLFIDNYESIKDKIQKIGIGYLNISENSKIYKVLTGNLNNQHNSVSKIVDNYIIFLNIDILKLYFVYLYYSEPYTGIKLIDKININNTNLNNIHRFFYNKNEFLDTSSIYEFISNKYGEKYLLKIDDIKLISMYLLFNLGDITLDRIKKISDIKINYNEEKGILDINNKDYISEKKYYKKQLELVEDINKNGIIFYNNFNDFQIKNKLYKVDELIKENVNLKNGIFLLYTILKEGPKNNIDDYLSQFIKYKKNNFSGRKTNINNLSDAKSRLNALGKIVGFQLKKENNLFDISLI